MLPILSFYCLEFYSPSLVAIHIIGLASILHSIVYFAPVNLVQNGEIQLKDLSCNIVLCTCIVCMPDNLS